MKNMLYVLGLLFSLTLSSQEEKDFVITDTTFTFGWKILGANWRYQKGDDLEWAQPEFDDSGWVMFTAPDLNKPDFENVLAERGEIAWFRRRIIADNTFTDALVLNIYQQGASEIYLDGKLIRQFGKVSANRDEIMYNNPVEQLLLLPLEKGKEQVLSVRYVNYRYPLPLYSNEVTYLRIGATTFTNSNSTETEKNRFLVVAKKVENNTYMALGIALLLFIIYLSFFIFFPREKINAFFAISMLFLILFQTGVMFQNSYSGPSFWIEFFSCTCIVICHLFLLYCFYKIFEEPVDRVFKILCFLGVVTIGCQILYEPTILAIAFAIIIYAATIRLCLKFWNRNRIASLLFMSSSAISLLFWSLHISNIMGFIPVSQYEFIPFFYMLIPVVLAIYLGFSFGKRSQDLRLNLERVQSLSKENESILSAQKVTLEKQVAERTEKLNRSLENLKATQSQLIQSEKMASLGELTAGIAHEIQNPLNFVNNFSEVSNELIDEMNEELDKGDLEEAKAISLDIKQNLEKITHHGKRADAIVKGMLQHSRSSSGTKEPTDINALADEYLRLAYHGLRAKDKSFNAELVTDFDETIGKIHVIPQEIGRVILNLITNAFYAVNEKKQQDEIFKPIVSVSTIKTGDYLEIKVTDNGKGIPKEVVDKIFQPFFTTKPTGQGTGLGLSMSYDIVTKGHGGELKVETEENEGTTFSVVLPIAGSAN